MIPLEDQINYFDQLIDDKIVHKDSLYPIIIKNSQFIGLNGCVYLTTSNIINISHSIFSASYFSIAIYIKSTSDVLVEKTCVSSCMSSTAGPQYGDVICIDNSRSLDINYCSLAKCITTLPTYPNGYAIYLMGSMVGYKNHNTSYCYGASMPGDYISTSELTYKHCYSGHTKCGIAAIALLFIKKFNIKEIILESVQSLDDEVIGFYDVQGKEPIIIENCTFLNLEVSNELYSSGQSLTAIGCIFSSSSPVVGNKVTLSPNLNQFDVPKINIDPIICIYDEHVPTSKKCKLVVPLVLWFLGLYDNFS